MKKPKTDCRQTKTPVQMDGGFRLEKNRVLIKNALGGCKRQRGCILTALHGSERIMEQKMVMTMTFTRLNARKMIAAIPRITPINPNMVFSPPSQIS